MKGVTKRQSEILSFIQEFIQSRKHSPSYREIMQHFGFSSLGSVYNHINILKRKGLISADKQAKRSIALANAPRDEKTKNEIEIPFIGHISAGFPLETFSNSQTLAVPDFLVPYPDKTYILQAKGDSLQEEMIADGDLLLVEARQQASSGETVLAIINQHDSIIKKYYPEGDYIRLVGSNPHHQPFLLKHEDIFIQGVLIGLIRQFV